MSRNRRAALGFIAVAAAGAVAAGVWWHERLPRRFGVVAAERLYRSGAVTPAQLARVQRLHGIERVISLLNADAPESAAERTAAAQLGLCWENVPLPGNGASTPADRDRLRALLTAADAPPTLVHCAAGVNRTGLAVGMYRLHVQGWGLEDVMRELRGTDFEDLPRHENLRAALAAEAELADARRAPRTAAALTTTPAGGG